MNSDARQIEIYHYIKKRGTVNVAALAEAFQVSAVTMRRALTRLEEAGLVSRSYGKVKITDTNKKENTFAERSTLNHEAKAAMAAIASGIIRRSGYRSIFFDGSTSALAVAEALPDDMPLTVFSHSCSVFEAMRDKPHIKLYFIGGFIDWAHQLSSGITTDDQCKQIYVDATFTSCGGFSENGTFDNGYTSSQVQRIMIRNSSRNYLLADHTKYNNQGIFMLNGWDYINTLITDRPLPSDFVDRLKAIDVQVLWE